MQTEFLEDILQMRNVTLKLPKKDKLIQILCNFSFNLKRGEVTGLIGETGCGKTLTARSILHILPKGTNLSGEIFFKGNNLLDYSERQLIELRRHEIALIPQNPMTSLDPLFTVRQQMFEILGKDIENSKKQEECEDALKKVELEPGRVLKSHPYELSGGMLQRVLIAMALIRRPKLIIADEITTALDLTTQTKILELLSRIKAEEELTMLLVTHDIRVVKTLCDSIVVMYVGQIVETGPTRDVLESPKHPYTKALLKSIPAIGKEALDPIVGIVPSFEELPTGCKFAPRCPEVFAHCTTVDPALTPISKTHVACHLYTGERGENT